MPSKKEEHAQDWRQVDDLEVENVDQIVYNSLNAVDSEMIDKKLLSILVCPVSKAPLDYDEEKEELICKASGLAYPVRDGIPVMLESEARQLTADEKLG